MHFSTHIPTPIFQETWKHTRLFIAKLMFSRVPHRPENTHWQISCDNFTLLVPIYRFYPSPYGFNAIIQPFPSLYTLYIDCIALIHMFRIYQHNLSLWHTIIRDCQDAILRSVSILMTSLILRIPLNVVSKWQ